MQAWLIAFAKSIFYDFVNWATRMLSTYFKQEKTHKKNEELVKQMNEVSKSDKPHEEKVQDAKDFLNNINKP